jgi:hypothetical protein
MCNRDFPRFLARLSLVLSCIAATVLGNSARAEDLQKGFLQPPDSAKPHTWWHWMNGNVTKEGITADLEAMARVGIGGAQLFNAAEGIPHGPIQFNSPQWQDLVEHAAKEARRLGLELCIHNCGGWSSSGGPWNTPEHGMKIVVTSEKQVTGPSRFEDTIPQPSAKFDFYRDIAVLAFRTPSGEKTTMRAAAPKVTVNGDRQDGAKAADGNNATAVTLKRPTPARPSFLQFKFAKPFAARSLTLFVPGTSWEAYQGKIEASDDGKNFRDVQSFSMNFGAPPKTVAFQPVSANVFRIVFTSAGSQSAVTVAEAELSAKLGIDNLSGKTFATREGNYQHDASPDVSPEEVVRGDQIVNLTDKMAADGRLTWDAPQGDWTILRLGYTPNGAKNAPSPDEGTGLECDKLSREAAQAHWDGSMGQLVRKLGPLAGNVKSGLNNVLIDSYEVGSQNWTQGFEKEFRKRRGYDITRFLPVFSGRVVDNPEVTERFLWDLRRTIADLFAENYSGKFAEMAHRAGLKYSVEPYGNCPSDDLQYGRYCDIPMSEFWPNNISDPGNAKLAASVAHVFGRKFVGAESFTADPKAGKWLKDPFSLKAQGDAVYCGGVNRIIYHRYAHQPWTNPTRYPGMTMGQWGTHFERTVTWWEQSKDWLLYQARAQYLLQQGSFVADVCFYCGEDAPNGMAGGGLPQGYDYDACETGALKSMSVKDGRITLPSGMSYRVLALPDRKAMTPAVLRKVAQLVKAGATVVGPKPDRSPSLTGYPACDAEVRKLADELWPNGVLPKSPTAALASLKAPPDFTCATRGANVVYIHRAVQGADVYFLSNQKHASDEVECSFRVSGKIPELWHPDAGLIEKAPIYTEKEGRITLPLRFDLAGSLFVVFRQPAGDADHAVAIRRTSADDVPEAKKPVEPVTILKAEYGAFHEETPTWADVTAMVKQILGGGSRRIAASNDLAGHDPALNVVKELKVDFLVDGKKKSLRATEGSHLELPANAKVEKALYGLIDETPAAEKPEKQTVDLTAKLAALAKDGSLKVKIDNQLAGSDPAYHVPKELRVEYQYKGKQKEMRVSENEILSLPPGDELVAPRMPAYDVAVKSCGDHAGAVEIQAWKPGSFQLTMASGKTIEVEAVDVPKPVEIAGSWQLSFPPNWGAPKKITLDKLISWTDHANPGVKYFSGTAAYRKTIAWNAARRQGERYLLDLGDLRNIAEVELNGRSLGVLWKPPYRVDVTDALRQGDNVLVVKITNLWPNRLIGDEQLPEDRQWNGIQLKEWPRWLLEGKPSPTGRYTFTTWHHWTKNDEPLPSGLFGPVLIRTAKTLAVK